MSAAIAHLHRRDAVGRAGARLAAKSERLLTENLDAVSVASLPAMSGRAGTTLKITGSGLSGSRFTARQR